jgi:hypothetical protein
MVEVCVVDKWGLVGKIRASGYDECEHDGFNK